MSNPRTEKIWYTEIQTTKKHSWHNTMQTHGTHWWFIKDTKGRALQILCGHFYHFLGHWPTCWLNIQKCFWLLWKSWRSCQPNSLSVLIYVTSRSMKMVLPFIPLSWSHLVHLGIGIHLSGSQHKAAMDLLEWVQRRPSIIHEDDQKAEAPFSYEDRLFSLEKKRI